MEQLYYYILTFSVLNIDTLLNPPHYIASPVIMADHIRKSSLILLNLASTLSTSAKLLRNSKRKIAQLRVTVKI